MAELGYRIESVADLERRLSERLATLKDGRDGADGVSLTIEDVRPAIAEYVDKVLAGWERPKDGQSVTIEDVEPMMREMISEAVAEIPAPKDGKDGRDGKSVDPSEIERMIADAVAALPPAPSGRDADPDLVAELVSEKVREAVEALPPPEKGEKGDPGPMGSLVAVEDYQDRVYYQGEVVTLDGSIYQAVRDTGKVPGHKDWRCIVRRGADGQDGRSFAVRSTWQADGEYRALDVVALNGASFVAKRDNPGPCPGDGWQLMAAQGKQGKPGAKGDRGERGEPGPGVADMAVDGDGLVRIVNGDGSTVECDLYPVLSKIGG